jgi:hypothetical protein
LLNTPTLLLWVLVVGGIAAFAVLAAYIVRRRVPESVHTANNEVAGFIFAVLGVIYGVLLAFFVLVSWQAYESSTDTVQREANALVDLYRLTEELPAPFDAQLRAAVLNYLSLVVEDEWPAMAEGRESAAAAAALEELWEVHRGIHASGVPLRFPPGDLYKGLVAVGNERRVRLVESEEELPFEMSILLWGGGIITIAFSLFFRAANPRAHLLMVAMLALVVAFSLFLILEIDSPFTGDLSVSPRPFEQALELIRRLPAR